MMFGAFLGDGCFSLNIWGGFNDGTVSLIGGQLGAAAGLRTGEPSWGTVETRESRIQQVIALLILLVVSNS